MVANFQHKKLEVEKGVLSYWIQTSLFSNEFLLSMMKILWKQEFCELGLDIWGAWLSNIVIENIISDIVEIQYFSIFPFPEKS